MIKTAVITGGAQRLGKSMVEFLASKGWNVIIHANSSMHKAKELAGFLRDKHPSQEFTAIQFDLSNWKDSGVFFDELQKNYGPIGLLVNNASLYSPGNIAMTTEELLEKMTAIHYYSPLMMSRSLAVSGNRAIIINILDSAIVNNHTQHSAYLLAKKSLGEFTRMAAMEWAPEIRVNGIAPGPVLPVEGKDQKVFDNVVDKTPLKRSVELDAFNASLDFLISNQNMTGQILFCDSGQHLL